MKGNTSYEKDFRDFPIEDLDQYKKSLEKLNKRVTRELKKKKYVGDIEAEFLDDNDDVLFTARVTLGNYDDIDKLLTLEEGDKTNVTFSTLEGERTVLKAKKFRLTSKLEKNSRAGKPGSELDELDEQMNALGKAADAFGAMAGAAVKAADAANEISKNR